MPCRLIFLCSLAILSIPYLVSADEGIAFPAKTWERKSPESVGLDSGPLGDIADLLGGKGCIIKDGYIVQSWGDLQTRVDWKSSAKPVLSTLLLFALQEGRIQSVDQNIADFGWDLNVKDRSITFRQLGAMTSGYARPEPPGEGYAYNDYAIQLYQKTLFDKVFGSDPRQVAEHPERLGALNLEQGLRFREHNRRMSASVLDFSRIAWLWANRGRWADMQLLPEQYFIDFCKPQVPDDLPHTRKSDTEDYLEIGTYGGGSDHFTQFGPGIYGFNWWFNAATAEHSDVPTWPDATGDAFMSIGAGGNCAIIIPSQKLVLVCADGDWGKLEPGRSDSKMNRCFRLLNQAIAAETTGEQD